jgi:hypothetical protein
MMCPLARSGLMHRPTHDKARSCGCTSTRYTCPQLVRIHNRTAAFPVQILLRGGAEAWLGSPQAASSKKGLLQSESADRQLPNPLIMERVANPSRPIVVSRIPGRGGVEQDGRRSYPLLVGPVVDGMTINHDLGVALGACMRPRKHRGNSWPPRCLPGTSPCWPAAGRQIPPCLSPQRLFKLSRLE